MQEPEAFITVKDRKEGFLHILLFRLINPPKFDMVK